MGWTDERVATLKKLWAEGHSASQIARLLGGTTRNSVIGKVHRLGLGGRATASAPARPPRPVAPAKPRAIESAKARPQQTPLTVGSLALRTDPIFVPEPQPMPQLRVVVCNDAPVPLLKLEPHSCRWPVKEIDGDHVFCGAMQDLRGGAYCEVHRALAFESKPLKAIREPYERPFYEPRIRSRYDVV